ncbi:hypothetical protein ACH3XW_50240 [Acanthocheilonema viteae]
MLFLPFKSKQMSRRYFKNFRFLTRYYGIYLTNGENYDITLREDCIVLLFDNDFVGDSRIRCISQCFYGTSPSNCSYYYPSTFCFTL